jgi:hypothetical protein
MKSKKPYWEMNLEELREATREYDHEMPGLPGKPLSPAMRKRLAQARRRGRPQIGLGAEKIRISLERGLLSQADAAAKRLRLTRSQLIARCLRAGLRRAG